MQGVIFIPDISGFTSFVKSVDINLGSFIINELLTDIINNNPLDLELSEIEGDAILFYKIGGPIPLDQVIGAFQKIYDAFEIKYNRWKLEYNLSADLSLKLIVHYGDIIEYYIKGAKKLYGETIIESHQLLKNGSGASDYILVTEDYLKAIDQTLSSKVLDFEYLAYKSQLYTNIKKLNYYIFSKIKKTITVSRKQHRQAGVLRKHVRLGERA